MTVIGGKGIEMQVKRKRVASVVVEVAISLERTWMRELDLISTVLDPEI